MNRYPYRRRPRLPFFALGFSSLCIPEPGVPPASGYDGGDCCSCTCPNVPGRECGNTSGWTCKDPNAPCVDFFIEAGTVTTVAVRANGFDTRPGEARGGSGCKRRGCRARLARDGDFKDDESRWSCRQSLAPQGEQCAITFSFAEALDIEYVQVASYQPDKHPRTLQVRSTGVAKKKLHLGTCTSCMGCIHLHRSLSNPTLYCRGTTNV